MTTNFKKNFSEAKVDVRSAPSDTDYVAPSTREVHHIVYHVNSQNNEQTKIGKVVATHKSHDPFDGSYNPDVHYNLQLDQPAVTKLLGKGNRVSKRFTLGLNRGFSDDDHSNAKKLEDHLNSERPSFIKKMLETGNIKVEPEQPELFAGKLPRYEPRMKESVADLFKLALEEKPNAFKKKFDEIMLSKIVDLSDEMKDELAQSMFGESSHEYGKKNKNKKMKESFEPEEDEDEYEADVEDEDFDLSDEDLDDLDLDDLDFEDEEDEISESEMKDALGDKPFGKMSRPELERRQKKLEREKEKNPTPPRRNGQ